MTLCLPGKEWITFQFAQMSTADRLPGSTNESHSLAHTTGANEKQGEICKGDTFSIISGVTSMFKMNICRPTPSVTKQNNLTKRSTSSKNRLTNPSLLIYWTSHNTHRTKDGPGKSGHHCNQRFFILGTSIWTKEYLKNGSAPLYYAKAPSSHVTHSRNAILLLD